MNHTILQFFQWYLTPEDHLWKKAKEEAKNLHTLGFTHIWLPPAYKSAKGIHEPGYAVYDLYDLGEFNQKGAVPTKYGTKEEYLQAIDALQKAGLQVLADVVLNHRIGAEEKEEVLAVTVKEENRKETIGKPERTAVSSRFTFPGRQDKYSDYQWDHRSFTGFCEEGDVKLILHEHTGGQWEQMLIEEENGNYDYLLGLDVEFRNKGVREELKKWGIWYVETTGVDGFRLDALKHISPGFYPEWIDHLKAHFKRDFVIIGEFWKNLLPPLSQYVQFTEGRIQLFDVPLHFNFFEAAQKKAEYDLRTIFNNTLVKEMPDKAVTFVENHDTQPLQSLESTVEAWFKPLAYALILLRQEGFPCAFYVDLYGAAYSDKKDGKNVYVMMNKVEVLPLLLKVRREAAYGTQRDFFDAPNLVGWTREGLPEIGGSGIVLLMSNGKGGKKRMSMGERNKGRKLVAISSKGLPPVILDEQGEGLFTVGKETIAVYVDERFREAI